ncbi:hypothetical protein BDI4_560046 [Burkholderia diffusa]|nr:hypothetical protein BDI4_560046 [Burkholderia diffusa]
MPGRRRAEGRDALPAGRLRPVRRVPRQALQPRNARSAVQGQEHQRSARHDGRARVRILQRGAGHRPQAEDAARRRPRLHPPRPVGHDAVGRRGAAREAVAGAVEARHGPHAVHPRRADHRPALPRHRAAARSDPPAARPGQHGRDHRAQPRRDQDRRLGDRPRPRGRRRRRPDHRAGHARAGREDEGELHRQVPRAAAQASDPQGGGRLTLSVPARGCRPRASGARGGAGLIVFPSAVFPSAFTPRAKLPRGGP